LGLSTGRVAWVLSCRNQINLIDGGSLGPLLVGHVVLVSCGIGLTHLLRREIHQHRSPDTPTSRLWPWLVLASVVISVVLAALVIGVNLALAHEKWDLISVVALWWGMFLATGVGIVLYVRFSERRGHEVREGQLEGAFREAQLQALESQISPHFLFNALNSIRALIEIDPRRAREMLTRLSNVLRNGLRRDNEHTVTLGSELEAVSDYLALETVRFADRLRSSVVADEGEGFDFEGEINTYAQRIRQSIRAELLGELPLDDIAGRTRVEALAREWLDREASR
jgi:hypothetical protein